MVKRRMPRKINKHLNKNEMHNQKKLFFNTTHLEGEDLIGEEKNARKQERLIMKVFRKENRGLTPWEVNSLIPQYFGDIIIITSTRRGITNLTEQGLLIKTDEKKLGNHKKMNYVWKLKTV